jgi:hypothetical protein
LLWAVIFRAFSPTQTLAAAMILLNRSKTRRDVFVSTPIVWRPGATPGHSPVLFSGLLRYETDNELIASSPAARNTEASKPIHWEKNFKRDNAL